MPLVFQDPTPHPKHTAFIVMSLPALQAGTASQTLLVLALAVMRSTGQAVWSGPRAEFAALLIT